MKKLFLLFFTLVSNILLATNTSVDVTLALDQVTILKESFVLTTNSATQFPLHQVINLESADGSIRVVLRPTFQPTFVSFDITIGQFDPNSSQKEISHSSLSTTWDQNAQLTLAGADAQNVTLTLCPHKIH